MISPHTVPPHSYRPRLDPLTFALSPTSCAKAEPLNQRRRQYVAWHRHRDASAANVWQWLLWLALKGPCPSWA